MKKIIIFVLICVFVVFAPGLVANHVWEDVYTIERREQAGKYTGRITVWHVVTFKTGAGSGVSFLRERADKFEDANAHVFIDVLGMTAQEAQERLSAGELPDIVSYPLGLFANGESFLPLEIPENLLGVYKDCGKYGENVVALPYMADSYALISNETLLDGLSIRLVNEPTVVELHDVMERVEFADIYPIAFSKTGDAISALEHLRFETEGVGSDVSLERFEAIEDGYEKFMAEEVAFYIAPYSEYERMLEGDIAFSAGAMGFSHYTDLVQMISVTATLDPAKAKMCEQFVQNLYRESVQQQLSDMKMLAVIELQDVMNVEYEELKQNGVIQDAFGGI